MLYGTVKWFDGDSQKRFGFIDGDDGNSYFFHMNERRRIDIATGSISFSNDPPISANVPEVGGRVVFLTRQASKGPKASPWTSENEYDIAQKLIDERPLYRICYTAAAPSGSQMSEPSAVWQGTNLSAEILGTHFNPKYDRGIYSHSDFESEKWWEISRDKGETWEKIDCPDEYKQQFDSAGRRRIPRH